jgi:predicted nucleic acid-binding protein
MTKSFFLDTNLLIYLHDPKSPEKRLQARIWIAALADRNALVISPQVVNEFCHAMRRKFPSVGIDEVSRFVRGLRPWCLAPSTFETSARGLALHLAMGFQFFDAVLIASALQAGCDFFLSEDMQDGRSLEGMTIFNPLKRNCAEFLAGI